VGCRTPKAEVIIKIDSQKNPKEVLVQHLKTPVRTVRPRELPYLSLSYTRDTVGSLHKVIIESNVDLPSDIELSKIARQELQKTGIITSFINAPLNPRPDAISFGGTVSPNGSAGVQVVAGIAALQIKVYAAAYEILTAGEHFYYFGTSTTAPTVTGGVANVFLSANAVGRTRQLYLNPMIGPSGNGLYLMSAVSDSGMPFDVQYVQE
jgi:hypothetical protein